MEHATPERREAFASDALPRPANDSGLGIHYYPDARHFTMAELRRWLPRLERLHVSWLTLRTTPAVTIPSEFLLALREAEIEPVVVIAPEPGEGLPTTRLGRQLTTYASAGLRYLSLLHEPNVETRWSGSAWQQPDLVGRVARLLLPALERVVDLGLWPLLPALRPGGDYWDTAFLASLLDRVGADGSPELLDRLGVAIQNFAANRPLDWGAGGRARWNRIRPYQGGDEDHRGWRLWEWYDEIARERLGRSLPLVATAGGPLVGTRAQHDLPALDPESHAERALEIVERVRTGALPDYLLNQSFWLLTAEPNDPAADQAWFLDDRVLPVVAALESSPRPRRADAASLARAEKPVGGPGHYLLLPAWEWGVSSLHWEAVRPFVQRARPTIGFDVEQAARASRVTLPIGMQGYGDETLDRLTASGCDVDAVPAPDYVTFRDEMARRARELG